MALLVVDGNNIAHRVRYTFNLSNQGVDVSVTYGFLSVLKSYLTKLDIESVIVCWDGGIPKFRRDTLPDYKANRSRDDDDSYDEFIRQVEELHQVVLPLCGITSVQQRYVEADDLIYQAAKIADRDIHEVVVIASGDVDMLQCTLMKDVFVFIPGKNKVVDASYIEEEWGINPNNFIHWRAIQGDTSDNIKGVPGIGPKTATKLFNEYGSLSNIINTAEAGNSLSTKVGDAIWEFGLEAMVRNVKVMALAFDRTGSRLSLLDAVEEWKPVNIKKFKQYCIDNAFISLMEPSLYSAFKKLDMPALLWEDIHTPRAKDIYRKPVTV